MSKDIIVIRPAEAYSELLLEDKKRMSNLLENIFKKKYIVVILFSENETNKTTFEIIKNE